MNRSRSNELLSRLKNKDDINLVSNLSDADIILVWWWDGFMLDTIKNNINEWKPFYGVNCGTLWFLLNSFEEDVPTSLDGIKFITENLLYVKVITEDDKVYERYAVWDIVIWGNILDYCTYNISSIDFSQKVIWTWLIISTVLWSSGYRLSNWGQILPLKSEIIWVMWIATKPFNYRLLKTQTISIKPESRHEIMVWIDWYWWKIDNVKELVIDSSTKAVTLWFVAKYDFDAKRIALSNQKLSGL